MKLPVGKAESANMQINHKAKEEKEQIGEEMEDECVQDSVMLIVAPRIMVASQL